MVLDTSRRSIGGVHSPDGGGSDAGMRIEELAMLFEGEPIGHTSDIVADHSGHPFCRNAGREAWRQLPGRVSIDLEEIVDDASRFLGHPDHSIVAVEMFQQKLLEFCVLALHGLAKSHQWLCGS